MLTLMVCLLLNFIYVQYKKNRKNKNILLINQKKDDGFYIVFLPIKSPT